MIARALADIAELQSMRLQNDAEWRTEMTQQMDAFNARLDKVLVDTKAVVAERDALKVQLAAVPEPVATAEDLIAAATKVEAIEAAVAPAPVDTPAAAA